MGERPAGGEGPAPGRCAPRFSRALRLALAPALILLFAAPYAYFARGGEARWLYVAIDAGVLLAAVAWRHRQRGAAPASTARALGLRAGAAELLAGGALAAAMAFAASMLLARLRADGIVFVDAIGGVPRRFFSASQAFHQELFARGLLLAWLARRAPAGLANAALAGGFAAAHTAFYGLAAGAWLPLTSLFTLTAFTFAVNHLFLARGHLWLGFALHAGWNVVRFGGEYTVPGDWIGEGESFALIEGAPEASAGALALALAVWGLTPGARPGDPNGT